jgi:hypothetical protein
MSVFRVIAACPQQLHSVHHGGYGLAISNLVQCSVKDREWEFESWSIMPWRIQNWNMKLGSIFREGYGCGNLKPG